LEDARIRRIPRLPDEDVLESAGQSFGPTKGPFSDYGRGVPKLSNGADREYPAGVVGRRFDVKKACAISLAAILCFAALASAGGFDGTIRQVNREEKWISVADASGQATRIYWNDATRVEGGDLKEGRSVSVKAIPKDGKLLATWVHVGAASGDVR
jgi:hypothetical protein